MGRGLRQVRGALISSFQDPRLAAVRRTGPLSKAMSLAFEAAVRARLAVYAAGLVAKDGAARAKVVSVGNLRVGGTGKTPVCLWLCEALTALGVRCGLCVRGYLGAWERGFTVVPQEPLPSVRELGDEAVLFAQRLRGTGTILAVGRQRTSAVQAVERLGAEVIVVDDAFSHLRLRRDLDIVLVTPEDLRGTTRLLPHGPLREPASSLRRAQLVAGLAMDWEGRADAPPVLFDVQPTGLVDSSWRCHDLTAYRGARVFLACGIARPERLALTARRAGLEVVGQAFFADHLGPSRKEARALVGQARETGADLLLWTEKDLPRLPVLPLKCLALRMTISPVVGQESLDRALAGLKEIAPLAAS